MITGTTSPPKPIVQNLTASVGRNTAFGIVANLAQVGTRLVTVPIVIHHLGLDGYGIWNIIMSTATYMRFGSVGVKTAFQKYVAEATGNGDYCTANKLLSTGTAIMLVLSVAGLIPLAFFSKQIAHFAGVPAAFLNSAAGAISLLALIMVMANVGASFESIVTGGHRIDLVRRCGTVLTVAEACTIILVLRLGYGLLAMAAVMGVSELLYVVYCWYASRRVLPQIRVSLSYLSQDVLYELVRYAGSYQLVNLLEVLCVSLIPFALLRTFGASITGVYAVVTRVVSSAAVLLDAFLPTILSGATMVFASGSQERMSGLLTKVFKATLALSLFPYGFIAIFGTTMTYAWVGQSDTYFQWAFLLVCFASLFKSFSLMTLVLYRVSGKALLDNIRQILRIGMLLLISVFAGRLGFYGVLAGVAITELAGMCFMLFAFTKAFEVFKTRSLLPTTTRAAFGILIILLAGAFASHLPQPRGLEGRSAAWLRLAEASVACLLVAWPVLLQTGSVTTSEGRAFLQAMRSPGTVSTT